MVLETLLVQVLSVGGDEIPNDFNQHTFIRVKGATLIYVS